MRPLRGGNRFLLLFAIAHAGSVVAYVPYLLLLLPARMAVLAPEARIEWLGAATLAGAISASIANVTFGWASDLVGTRRWWVGAGLCLTLTTYVLLSFATTPLMLVASVVAYQAALNMMLAPLAAWAADCVPDDRKGVLGGLLGAGQPVGMLAGVIVTLPLLAQPSLRLSAICLMVAALMLPLLLVSRSQRHTSAKVQVGGPQAGGAARDFGLMWAARLLVQVAGSALFVFLVYYFQSLPEPPSEAGVARLTAASLALAFPVALLLGRQSDRMGRRKPFLIAAALGAAAGLILMAVGEGFTSGAIGYALFASTSSVFLALHTGFAMQLLPSPTRRGRDLGVLNLANTVPAIIAPVLAIWLVPGGGFGLYMGTLAGFAILAALCIALIRNDESA